MMSVNDTVISIENPRFPKEIKRDEVNILCFDITRYSQLSQLAICSLFVFVCYLAYGYFLELIFSKPEVKSISLYITLVQFFITTLLSYVESVIREPIKRKVPLHTYGMLAALTLGTMALSNLALSYLNYPTQVIFKSCKLLPVMIGSIFIMGKKYGFLDYIAAILMCVGLTMFTIADSKTSPNFNIIGVLVISLALLCDAVIGNVQEKAMKKFQATNNEIVFYSYAIACGYLFAITVPTGILLNGFYYYLQEPLKRYTQIALLSVTGYLGLQAVLSLVRVSGATVAVTVTTMRKALSIVISFLLFSKPFAFQYVWSGILVLLAIYVSHYSKQRPGCMPAVVKWCVNCLHGMYQNEYRYLKLRSKGSESV